MSTDVANDAAADTVPLLAPGLSVMTVGVRSPLFPAAELLELDVFLAAGYTEPGPHPRVVEYEPWRASSSFVAVVDEDRRPIGVVRVLFGRYAELPVGKFEAPAAPAGLVCENASLAVRADCRATGVAETLYREVWRQALVRRATAIVALVDPWLLVLLRNRYASPFEELGEAHRYMGGDVRPIGVTLDRLHHDLRAHHPDAWQFMFDGLSPAERRLVTFRPPP